MEFSMSSEDIPMLTLVFSKVTQNGFSWLSLGVTETLMVSYCVEVRLLLIVIPIFCFTSFGDHNIRNTKKPQLSCIQRKKKLNSF